MGLFNNNIGSEELDKKFGIIPFYDMKNSYQSGGIIHKNPKFINDEELKQYIKNVNSPSLGGIGGQIHIAPYKMGGTLYKGQEGIGSVIPSTLLSPFNQIGNIIRPNSLQINRSRQAIINKNLI
jgi:hypothetical protein